MSTKILSGIVLSIVLPVAAANATISQVPYAGLTGTGFEGFEGLLSDAGAGVNYNGPISNVNLTFGESLTGQTVVPAGDFDTLVGNPNGPVSVAIGLPNQNLTVLDFGGSNVIVPNGPAGHPNFNAVGEGSLAFVFNVDQGEFGFQLVGGDGGDAVVSFYDRAGNLIDSELVTGLANSFYGFSRDGGINDIAGVTITNNDGGGIGLDNLRFTIPTPGAMALFGFAGLASIRRRR